jgi:hypothetical protein
MNRRGEAKGYRTICPHGQPPSHCQGRLISFRVVRKRTVRTAAAAATSPIGARHGR